MFSQATGSTTLLHLICTRFVNCKINCIKKIKIHFRIIFIRLICSFVSFDRIVLVRKSLIHVKFKAHILIKKTIKICSGVETCKHCTSNTTSLMSLLSNTEDSNIVSAIFTREICQR